MKNQRGFTLIEVIVYIALFSILIGTAFATAYHMIDNSRQLNLKDTLQEEGNFVIRKINWALTGVKTITTPSTSTPTSGVLTLEKWNGDVISIQQSGTKIELKINSGSFTPITTDNVSVSSLSFSFISGSTSLPSGVVATFTINDKNFSVTKYMRK